MYFLQSKEHKITDTEKSKVKPITHFKSLKYTQLNINIS